ncbi:MAG: HAMP domain-containing sensor histidine kinase [Gammaproteobacteria bacterium]|nr:HAMP domain-containing sensor histidine kinase [Gammaproteobacteria bacterium]
MKINKSITLEKQIRHQVTNRIICCGVLLFCMFIATTIFDFYVNIERLATSLNITASELSNYITTQELIGNQQAVTARLNKMSQGSIIFEWLPVESTKIAKQKTFQEILWSPYLHWSYFYQIPKVGIENFGYLKISSSLWKDSDLIRSFLIRGSILLLFFIGTLFFLYPLARRIPNELFVAPIENILHMVKPSREIEHLSPKILLATELQTIRSEIIDLLDRTKLQSHKEALLLIATQVAHDIRSPLAALNIMIKTTDSIPEKQRIMIRNATQRINDIANNLLSQHRQSVSVQSNDQEKTSAKELVAALLDQVVSEKRIQLQDKQLVIDFHGEQIYGIFVEVSAVDFKRVISNLINNAVESITQNGIINISLTNSSKQICIEIKDNGCGMPHELQQSVLQGGITIGKTEGNGIGLSSSKRLIESWGGNIKLESQVNQGTTVHIFLPKSQPADWFLSELTLFNDDTIIILDDDQSIHDIWESHIEQYNTDSSKITKQHYYLAEPLMEDIKNIPSNARFLLDFELRNSKLTGLDVVKSLGIASRTTLVTSRDEELNLRSECEKLGIKILPKVYAAQIPIKIYPRKPDLVFIDDDQNLTNA